MKLYWYSAGWIIGLTFFSGCFVTEEYSSYRALQRDGPSHIRVMTRDTVLYALSDFHVLDSTLQGEGTREVDGKSEAFNGIIPLGEVVYVQGRDFSFIRTLLAGFTLGAAAYLVTTAGQSEGLRVWRPVSGSGSCPYVYAWDGNAYQIQGETFGTAFGKALETTTSCMLPAVADQEGEIRILLANERPETHYVNNVSLFACEAPRGSTVVLDVDQRPWSVVRPLAPVVSPSEMRQKDDIYWKSNLGGTLPGGGFRDTVELTLPGPDHPAEGSLIVHAINTELINAVYDIVFRYLGDQSLLFLYEVEHNQDLIGRLKEWIKECSLTVEVWKGGKWVSIGMIPPEANYVPFTKIVRVGHAVEQEKELRVRLTTLAHVWQIDAVQLDWTSSAPLTCTKQTLLSSSHSVTGPIGSVVQRTDNIYSIMFPGERIDMAFSPRPASGDKKVFYFLKAGGYLYEGLPEENANELPALFASFDANRVQTVCKLVGQREAFLGLVYNRWRAMQTR